MSLNRRIPALTLWQPWATLIAHGGKTVENRTWRPPKKLIGGPLAIHAGKTWERGATSSMSSAQRAAYLDAVRCLGVTSNWPTGAIVAVARLDGVLRPGPGSLLDIKTDDAIWWDDYQYGWILRDVRTLDEPIPAKGRQGVWLWQPPEGFEL